MKIDICYNTFWAIMWVLLSIVLITMILVPPVLYYKNLKLVSMQPDCVSKVIQDHWGNDSSEILAIKSCEENENEI
jgi:hypothetical protein